MATNRASSASLNLWLGSERPASAGASSQNPITVSGLALAQFLCMVQCHVMPEGLASCSAPGSVFGTPVQPTAPLLGQIARSTCRRWPGGCLGLYWWCWLV